MSRAEHLLEQEEECQAEQQNHHSVRDRQADQQDKVRDRPEQTEGRNLWNQPLVQQEEEDDWSELTGRDEHLLGQETEHQAEQQKQQRLENHRAEPRNARSSEPEIECKAEHHHRAGYWRDQAEKGDRGDEEEWIIGVTQNTRQSSTIPDAVARYVGVPITSNQVSILISNNSGSGECQAEQRNQVTGQPEQTKERNHQELLKVQPGAENCKGRSVSRAEHLPRPKAKCRAEQQTHPAVKPGTVSRAEHLPGRGAQCQAEQQIHPQVRLGAGDDWGGSVSRAEHLPRPGEQCQAEQQIHPQVGLGARDDQSGVAQAEQPECDKRWDELLELCREYPYWRPNC